MVHTPIPTILLLFLPITVITNALFDPLVPDSNCFPFFTLAPSCLPKCPSGYSSSLSTCSLNSKSLINSEFLPLYQQSLTSSWKSSQKPMPLTENRGIFLHRENHLNTTEVYSFGGVLNIELWIHAFGDGLIVSSENLRMEKLQSVFNVYGNLLSYQGSTKKTVKMTEKWKAGWNFISLLIIQSTANEVILTVQSNSKFFFETLFFIPDSEIVLGGLSAFIYKFALHTSIFTSTLASLPLCSLHEYVQSTFCHQCTKNFSNPDCILFSNKKRKLLTCTNYNYNDVLCMNSCPTGYSAVASSCKLTATSYFSVNFEYPNTFNFQDSTGTVVFVADYQINAYKRGIYFSNEFGNVTGNEVQLAPDFELFLYILPKSLNGVILWKNFSPLSIFFDSLTGNLNIGLENLNISMSTGLFTVNTWLGVTITSQATSATQATLIISLDLTQILLTTTDLLQDPLSQWYLNPTLTFTGFLFQLCLSPTYDFFIPSDLLSTSCYDTCNSCPAQTKICLSTCAVNEYFSSFSSCFPCNSCPSCIRPTSCSLNINPLCSQYSEYEFCSECKIFSSVGDSGVCQCDQYSSFVSKEESCCGDLCLECGESPVFCENCAEFGFQGVCLGDCPSLTVASGKECVLSDEDAMMSFKFEVAGNYVKDSSLTPVSGKFYKSTSNGEQNLLNPFIGDGDPYPGLGRGLYIHEFALVFDNFMLSPIHTWLIWTKISTFGTFLKNNAFYLLLNSTSSSIGYKGPINSNIFTDFPVSINEETWYFIYLSTNIQNNLATFFFTYNQEAVQSFSPSPAVYVFDSLGTLALAPDSFTGWVYRIEYFVYFIDSGQLEEHFFMILGLNDCGIKQFVDENGLCQDCANGCETCLDWESCLVCKDAGCYSCYDYFTDECLRCGDGQVFFEDSLSCQACLEECSTCYRPQKDTCITCSQSYFMSLESLCLPTCPTGFISISNICQNSSQSSLTLHYKFIQISDPVLDLIQSIPLKLGPNFIYEPKNPFEPQILPNRGLYFQSQSYASTVLLNDYPSYVCAGNTHTIEFWVMPMVVGHLLSTWSECLESVLIEILVVEADFGFEIKVNYYLQSVFQLDGLTQVQMTLVLKSLNTWVQIAVSFQFVYSSSELALYLNGDFYSQTSAAGLFLNENPDTRLFFGAFSDFSGFSGYFYSFQIFAAAFVLEGPIACSCSLCTQNGDCLITCLPLEYWTGTQCSPCNSNCTQGCSRSENCVLHPDALCEYFSILQLGNCDACVNLAENTEKCECVQNSNPLSDLSACVCNKNFEINNNQCVSCVDWAGKVNSSYSNSFESIIFLFDIQIYNNNLTCEDVFTGKSLRMFGLGYSCVFTSNQIVLNLGDGASFVYGEIEFQYKKIFALNGACEDPPGVLKSDLKDSGKVLNALSVMDCPEYVLYECDDLVVDGSGSLGAGKRQMLYKWTVFSEVISNLSRFSTDFQENSVLIIPKTSLFTCVLNITLTVQNAFGFVSSQSCSVPSVILTENMILYYDKHISFDFLPNIDNYFDFFAYKCNPIDKVQVKWKLLSVTQNSSSINTQPLWSSQKRNGQLLIPSNTFPPYSTINLQAYIDDSNSNILAKTQISLRALPVFPQIFVDLANGTVGSVQDLVINVSVSFDYNLTEFFEVNWKCFGELECNVAAQNSSYLKIVSGELQFGQVYYLQLGYKGVQNETDSGVLRSVMLNVSETILPVVNIYEFYTGMQIQVLNIDNPAGLQAEIRSDFSNISYYWAVVSETPLVLGEVGLSTLTINTQYLIPGCYYKFKLEIETNGFKGEYFYEFTVNHPPVVENLQVWPKAGLEFFTTFQLQAVGSYDQDNNYPLKYTFGYYFNTQQVMLNLKNQSLVFWTQLPYTGGVVKVFVIAYDSLGSACQTGGLAHVSHNEKFNQQVFFDQVKQTYSSSFFDLQSTSGLLSLLSSGILNRQLLIGSNFSKADASSLKLFQQCFDFCIQALTDMENNIVNYDLQGIKAISTAVSMISLNPNLQSIENAGNLVTAILQFLAQTPSGLGMDFKDFQNFVNAGLNAAPWNSSMIFGNPQVLADVIKVNTKTVSKVSKQIGKGETVYSKLNKAESVISGVDRKVSNFTVKSEVYGSKVVFMGNMSELLGGFEGVVSLLTIPEEEQSGFYENSDKTRPAVVDISLFVNSTYTPVTTAKGQIIIHIPVSNLPPNSTPQCAYLNLISNTWKTDGCSLLQTLNSTIICSCSHLSSFSILGFFQSSLTVAESTNIKTAFNILQFQNLNSQNAAGLYFFSFIIVLYWVLAYFLHRIDLKKREFSTTPLEPDTVLTARVNNNLVNTPKDDSKIQSRSDSFNPQQEFSEVDQKMNEEHKESENLEEGKQNEYVFSDNMLITDAVVEVKRKKSVIEKFVETGSKGYKEQLAEAHELFKIIYRPDMFETRVMLLTVLYIKVLLQVFLIGLFYKNKDGQQSLNYSSVKIGFLQYSVEDFWIMVYSNLITLVVVMVPSYLLGFSETHKDYFPFRFRRLPVRLRIKRTLGYLVSAGVILFCGMSISLFSVNFTEGTKNIWIVGTILSVFLEIFVVSIAKQVGLIFLKKVVARVIVSKWVVREEEE